jgi:hypothetical protein
MDENRDVERVVLFGAASISKRNGKRWFYGD